MYSRLKSWNCSIYKYCWLILHYTDFHIKSHSCYNKFAPPLMPPATTSQIMTASDKCKMLPSQAVCKELSMWSTHCLYLNVTFLVRRSPDFNLYMFTAWYSLLKWCFLGDIIMFMLKVWHKMCSSCNTLPVILCVCVIALQNTVMF